MDERFGGRIRTVLAAIRRPREEPDWGHQACAACQAALIGIDSVALAIYAPSRTVNVIGVSGALAERAEDTQIVVGEGPGRTAFTTGQVVLVPDLAGQAQQWTMFVREATQLGIGAMFAFPLQVGGIRIGALDLCRRQTGPLPTRMNTNVTLLASLISYTLVEDLIGDDGFEIPSFTTSNRDINVATGMIAAQLGITIDEAFVRLRAAAFAAERPLADIARDVLERRLDLDSATE
ncbi:GAF and ANTAR domain-containing protein [Nocardia miyunensis]|uniref:GAF and ANTAR domain-containing protein n=1 Tax=Nocardia miyunensis TaxID=282684 RepID=UPI000A96D91E|nr:GAF and ANTAR domain-containing protein [Nocardia miyunensis]